MSHVDTLAAVHQMATCLTMQQMYDSAVPLFTRILRAEEEAGHGPESSQVIAASAHLGICLFKAGRAGKGLAALQHSLVDGAVWQLTHVSEKDPSVVCLDVFMFHAVPSLKRHSYVGALFSLPCTTSFHVCR